MTTFAQMKQAIENARAQMQKQQPSTATGPTRPNPDAQNVKMSFDVKVRNTGVQKEISGLESSESIMTLMMNATDTQTQQSGSMAITNDMWMVPAVPGYGQVSDFYKRFGAKMSDATVGLGFDFSKMLAQNPAAGEALSDMAGEMQKLKGVPIMQVMRMGTTVQPLPPLRRRLCRRLRPARSHRWPGRQIRALVHDPWPFRLRQEEGQSARQQQTRTATRPRRNPPAPS